MRNSILKWVYGFLLSGCIQTVLLGQTSQLPLEFHHIQEQQGLSYNVVNSFLQDRDGQLWIGTYGGLDRFDGSHFTTFKIDRQNPDKTLGNNIVHDLCQDNDGNIWAATNNGISRYDRRTGRFFNVRKVEGFTLGKCLNILCDRQGRIWFTSHYNGLFQIDPKTTLFCHYSNHPEDPASLSGNIASKNGLVEDPRQDGLWITLEGDAGLNYVDMKSGQCLNFRNNPDKSPIFQPHETSALTLDGSRQLIFADNTTERVLVYNLENKTVEKSIVLTSKTGQSSFPMGTIFVDRSHNLWTSSWTYRLFFIEAQSYQSTELFHDVAGKTSVAGDFFWAGWQQPDGTIWFGTINGISYTNPEKTFYRIHNLGQLVPELNRDQGLASFLEDPDESWWFTSVSHKLIHYDPVQRRAQVYPIPIPKVSEFRFNLPLVIASPKRDELFICTLHAVLIFNKRTRQFSQFPLPPMVANRSDGLNTLLLVQGDWLWLFATSDVVFQCHLPTKQWRTFPMPFGTGNRVRTRAAGFDRKGVLWADVLDRGIVRFSKEIQQFTDYLAQPRISEFTDHFGFRADAQNRLWSPVSGYGLIELNTQAKTYRTWTEQDGLFSNDCKAVCTDSFGHIWVASFNKFSIFNPARSSFQNFTLPINEATINYINYMYNLRNRNILTTLKGYAVEFMPQRVNSQLATTNVLISTVTQPDTTIVIQPQTASVRLGANENNFSINYSALSLPQQSYTYFYKLDNYDDHWVRAGSRTVANYTKIPGGNYVFRVKALVGKKETTETTLTILVDTAFYNTRWFKLGMLLVLAGLIYGGYRYRIQQTSRLHHLKIQATRLERDKTEIQYQNLINHLNPHFLFNSLTSLNSLIITEPKQASRFLQKLSAIYRYILQNRDRETVSLENELNFVQHYIILQKSRFEDGLLISIDVPEEYLIRQVVPVTLQNLFENAIKHNTIDDDDPLSIRVFIQEEYLCVENNLQRKRFVETSNQQGLENLKTLYRYLSSLPLVVSETDTHFIVKVPLL
jgi:ligand-binding sensor domain-containing protein